MGCILSGILLSSCWATFNNSCAAIWPCLRKYFLIFSWVCSEEMIISREHILYATTHINKSNGFLKDIRWSHKINHSDADKTSLIAVFKSGHAYSLDVIPYSQKVFNKSGSACRRIFSIIPNTFNGGKGWYSNHFWQ